MIFISYSFYGMIDGLTELDKDFRNVMFEDITIEPKDEKSLYELTRIVEQDLKERIGYEAVNAKILWWKLL